jgi:small conductance mechanosensitive channel
MNNIDLPFWIESRAIPALAHIVLICLLAWLSYRLLAVAIRRVEDMIEDDDPDTVSERERRAETLAQIVQNSGLVLIGVIAGAMILRELGLDIGPLLAGVGIVGLAIGFGAQTLVKDVISGVFVLIENQFAVGDSVQIGSVSGTVEKMTLRAAFLRDASGTLHVIPNGEIRVLANKTKGWARAVVDVRVSYDTNLDEAMDLLRTIGQQLHTDPEISPLLLEEPSALGPTQFGETGITIRLMAKTRAGQQWHVEREIRRRVKTVFSEAGIDISPQPRYEISMRGTS